MRYALLAVFLIAVLLVSLAGQRGKIHSNQALRLFPDMDEQEILRPQAGSEVFADGLAARRPVEGTIPVGYAAHEGERVPARVRRLVGLRHHLLDGDRDVAGEDVGREQAGTVGEAERDAGGLLGAVIRTEEPDHRQVCRVEGDGGVVG